MNFIPKYWKSGFELPFGGLRGNVRTSSIALWKARGRFPIRRNWIFSLSVIVEMLYAEICQSRSFSKGVGYFEANKN